MIHKTLVLFVVLTSVVLHTISSQLPATDVYRLELDANQQPAEIYFMNEYNVGKYNNQPSFVNDTEVLLTSELSDGRTDVIKWNLRNNSYRRLTSTVENEYSPKILNETSFLVVRQEQDGKTQSLWSYPNDLSNSGSRLFNDFDNIGYFQPLPNFKIALFTLEGENFPLYIGNLRNETTIKISDNVGRCFQESKKGELIYMEKQKSGKFRIKSYNTINQQIDDYAQGLDGSQDFCLYGPREDLLMAVGPEIFRFDRNSNSWVLWQDLAKFGILNITRISSLGNTLLIVNNRS